MVNAETHNLSKHWVSDWVLGYEWASLITQVPSTSTQDSDSAEEEEEEDSRSQRTVRKSVRCHFLEMTRPLCTWTHTDVATCTGQNSIKNWGGAHKVPALSEKLLEVKGCFGRDSLLWGFARWEVVPHSYTYGQHQLDSVSYLKSTKQGTEGIPWQLRAHTALWSAQVQLSAYTRQLTTVNQLQGLWPPQVYVCHTYIP